MNSRRPYCWIGAAVLVFAAGALRPDAARAADGESSDHPEILVPRLILAVYDGRDEADVRWTRLHRYVEFVLNHLGFQLVYRDISREMPSEFLEPDYAAVISWFKGAVPDTQTYAAWAAKVQVRGRPMERLKFVVLGDTGLSGAPTDPRSSSYLKRIGIGHLADDHRFGPWGRLTHRDASLIGFERDFFVPSTMLPLVKAAATAKTHLSLSEPDTFGGATTDLVVAATTGGYVEGSALVRYDPDAKMSFWVLNPFQFFEGLLASEPRPIPDTTTLNGRRIFFCDMQGDGWTAVIPADRANQPLKLAGSAILSELLLPYQDLPVSVSLITGDLTPELGGKFSKMGEETARAVFGLANVEAGSNTWTQPLRWGFFEHYRRDDELHAVEQAANKTRPSRGLLTEAFSNLASVVSGDLSHALAARASGLRKYTRDPFDLDQEIAGSLSKLNALSPPDRRASLISWGGDGQIFEAALAEARRSGVPALGGQGGLYDSIAPSISNLTPQSVQVGNERQIYHALGGDALYTNYWTAPIHGLLRLQSVLNATNQPKRLKPFELSYGAFSALRFGSLNAIKVMLDRAREDFVVPIHTSQYARIVEGFASTRILEIGPRTWRIQQRGALQTIRFDAAAEHLSLDMTRSRGVLGGRHEKEAFYVSLDPSEEKPVIAIAAPQIKSKADSAKAQPLFELDNSRWMINRVVTHSCKAEFDATGFGPGVMTWLVPQMGSYRIEVYDRSAETSADQPIFWQNSTTLTDNRSLTFSLPDVTGRPVHVAISSCISGP